MIRETLRHQAGATPRTGAQRLFGKNPLVTEALPWYRGAQGELAMAHALSELPPAWRSIHAMPIGTRGADVDHVVIGPGGVITINAKRHHGAKVWVGSRRLLVNGQKTDHLRNARYEAERIRRELSQGLGYDVSVRAAIALVDVASITIRERPTDVEIGSPGDIVRRIRRRPALLDSARQEAVTTWFDDEARWVHAVTLTSEERRQFDALSAEVSTALRVRRAWVVGAMLALASITLPLAAALLGAA